VKLDNLVYRSRSEGVDRLDCRRLRLLGDDLDGTGYRQKAGSVPLLSGDAFHRGISTLVGHHSGIKTVDLPSGITILDYTVERIISDYRDEVIESGVRNLDEEHVRFTIEEQQTMLEGMLRGWEHYRLPLILEEYEIVETEQQWLWQLGPGIYVPLRQDFNARRRDDGMLYIFDAKGIPYGDSDTWQSKHEYSDQTSLYITALEERTGEPVGGMIYEGLVRGQWKKETAKNSPYHGRKIQMSAYCYGYGNLDYGPSRENNWEGVQAGYTNRKGWEKFRVKDHFDVTEWLEVLKRDEVLPELFITMIPTNPAPEFRQRIRRQRYLNEARYQDDLDKFEQLLETKGLDHPDTQMHLDLFAEQNMDRCDRFGEDYRCPFKPFCTAPNGGLDMLREDDSFEPRKPHHDLTGLIPLDSLRRAA
jgi:hypothetical protein